MLRPGCANLESPPPEIVERGIPSILPYMKLLWTSRETSVLGLGGLALKAFAHTYIENLDGIKKLELQDNEMRFLPDDMPEKMSVVSIPNAVLHILRFGVRK
eukprot:2955573-Rhodomonas_salina.3